MSENRRLMVFSVLMAVLCVLNLFTLIAWWLLGCGFDRVSGDVGSVLLVISCVVFAAGFKRCRGRQKLVFQICAAGVCWLFLYLVPRPVGAYFLTATAVFLMLPQFAGRTAWLMWRGAALLAIVGLVMSLLLCLIQLFDVLVAPWTIWVTVTANMIADLMLALIFLRSAIVLDYGECVPLTGWRLSLRAKVDAVIMAPRVRTAAEKIKGLVALLPENSSAVGRAARASVWIQDRWSKANIAHGMRLAVGEGSSFACDSEPLPKRVQILKWFVGLLWLASVAAIVYMCCKCDALSVDYRWLAKELKGWLTQESVWLLLGCTIVSCFVGTQIVVFKKLRRFREMDAAGNPLSLSVLSVCLLELLLFAGGLVFVIYGCTGLFSRDGVAHDSFMIEWFAPAVLAHDPMKFSGLIGWAFVLYAFLCSGFGLAVDLFRINTNAILSLKRQS